MRTFNHFNLECLLLLINYVQKPQFRSVKIEYLASLSSLLKTSSSEEAGRLYRLKTISTQKFNTENTVKGHTLVVNTSKSIYELLLNISFGKLT